MAELKNAALFPIVLKRGLKKHPSFIDCSPEERWGNEVLRQTEQWMVNHDATAAERVVMPWAAWLLNSCYLRPAHGKSFPIGIMGRKGKNGELGIIYSYPCLVSFNPEQIRDIKQRFENDLRPQDPSTKAKISVVPLFVGDKTAQVSFEDEARKEAEETGYELIGIYHQDLLAELKTICKPGWAERIYNHPWLIGAVRHFARQGEKLTLDQAIINLIMHHWAPKFWVRRGSN